MAGAPAMAGWAALRSGAGLVTVAVPACVQPTVASYCAAYMTLALADAAAVDQVMAFAQRVDAVAIGPGLGRSPAAQQLLSKLYRELECPLVVDADGLNLLANHTQWLAQPGGPRVLTPHAGEFARLVGRQASSAATPADDDARSRDACDLAACDSTGNTTVVLKGHRTVVASGDRFAINTTGNAGMATGGTGDVLTGVVVALLAQGHPAFAAARLAVHVHGLAGDLARDALGEIGMMATDVLDWLPHAWRRLGAAATQS
jgi:NAD(P)H-hydrate epimerase